MIVQRTVALDSPYNSRRLLALSNTVPISELDGTEPETEVYCQKESPVVTVAIRPHMKIERNNSSSFHLNMPAS